MKTVPDAPPPRPFRSRLAFHLAIALIVKVILLTLLWHAFIKPSKVDMDIMGSRIAAPTPSVPQARLSITPGDNK